MRRGARCSIPDVAGHLGDRPRRPPVGWRRACEWASGAQRNRSTGGRLRQCSWTRGDIEAEIRGQSSEVRREIRQQRSKPVVEAMKPWLEASLAKVSKGSNLAEALGVASITGMASADPRGRPYRDRLEHGRALDPRSGSDSQERTLRRS
jgi:hypothetical protein